MKTSEIAFNDTAFIHYTHPGTGEELFSNSEAVGVVVHGVQSKAYREAKHSALNARMANKRTVTSQQVEQDAAALLADCVVEFKNLEGADGNPLTKKDAKKLFLNPKTSWMKDQTDEGIALVTNFIQKSEEKTKSN